MNLIMIAMISCLFLLPGCGSSPSNDGSAPHARACLRINIGEDPSTLDPRKSRSLCDRTLVNMLYEGLTRINREEKVEPAMAQVIEVSSDLMTYTFYLRQAKWTNGESVKASDFAYSWQKMLDPSFASPNASQLYPIKNAKAIKDKHLPMGMLGIEVIDPYTLKVSLEQPTPYFLEMTAFPAFFPVCESVDRMQQEVGAKSVSTPYCGPFRLQSWKHNDQLQVVKNEQYWDATAVKLQEIAMYMVKEETEMRMFEKKELDWVGSPLSNIPIDAIMGFKKGKALQSKAMLGTYFLRLNTKQSILSNVNIRKAIAIAIDRQALVEHVLQGDQTPATGLVPLSLRLQTKPYFQDHDVQEAKRLFSQGLAELGTSANALPPLVLIFPTGEKSNLLSQAIQQHWLKAFGLQVSIQAVERKVYYDRLANQDYDIAAGSWIADFNDPINFLEIFKYQSTNTNNTSWENNRYIQLLDESSAQGDPAERRLLLAQSEDLLIKEMPIIPIFHYNMLFAKQGYLKEIVLSSMGNLDFKWAYLENEDK
ncbi:MAG: peptide ABC transporter substrate-binding protein [Chlamydiia bacterium]